MQDLDQRRLLAALCHGSIFFSSLIVSIGIPIAILLMNDNPVIKENAKEAINFHINLYLYGILAIILAVTIIGIPISILLGVLLAIASFVMPIIAIVYTLDNLNRPYHYPFIWRLL
jgi:uncharacterized Tic20 family protein